MTILQDPKLRWLIFAGVLVGIFEFLSLGGVKLPPYFSIPLFTIIIIAIGHQTLKKGFIALRKLNFQSINLLMVIAVIGAFYLGEYEEAAVVIVLFTLAEHLEDVGIARSKSALDGLVESMPSQALRKGEERPVNLSEISFGDVIIIKPHQTIPLDGDVIEGDSFVDESTITGEAIPQDKRKGDQVFAGTMNKQGVIEVQVTRLAAESTIAKIRELTFDAIKHKAKTQKFIEKFSSYYTPSILLLAVVCDNRLSIG